MSGRPTCLVRSATGRPRLTPTPTDRSGDTLLLYLDQNYLSGIVKRKAAFRELEPALRAVVRSRRSRRPRVRDPSTARRRCTSPPHPPRTRDRKSTRLNSSHITISYAVFCLKKKKKKLNQYKKKKKTQKKNHH